MGRRRPRDTIWGAMSTFKPKIPDWYRQRVLAPTTRDVFCTAVPYPALMQGRRKFWIGCSVYVALLVLFFKPVMLALLGFSETRWPQGSSTVATVTTAAASL